MDGSPDDSRDSVDLINRGYSSSLIAHTKRVWQPYSVALLSDQEAEEIISNVLDLAAFLWALSGRGSTVDQSNIS